MTSVICSDTIRSFVGSG